MTRTAKMKQNLVLLCLCACTAFCGGLLWKTETQTAKAEQENVVQSVKVVDDVTFTMQSGATIKSGADADGTTGEVGLRAS